MLNLFDELQKGLLSPTSFMFSHVTRQVFKFGLSKHVQVENTEYGALNCMDMEQVEQRYLLSATNSSGLFVHDLYNYTGQPDYTCKIIGQVNRSNPSNHEYSILTVRWYPFDTGMFTTSAMDSKLKLWDTNKLMAAVTVTLREKVYSHDLSPIATGHTLIATAQAYPHVVLVDMRTGSSCHELYGHTGKVTSVKWSPSCEYLLASGGKDNKILLWDIRSAAGYLKSLDQHNSEASNTGHKKDASAHYGKVNGLCFSPDGLYLLSTGTDSEVRLWDVAKAQNMMVNYGNICNKNYRHVQMDMCYNAAVPTIFVPSSNNLLVFDMFSGSKITELRGHFGSVNCCIFRSRYNELYSLGNDQNIHVWNADNSQESLNSSSTDHWSD